MLLESIARLWYARMLRAAPSTPSPRNGPTVRAGTGLADRVLLVGNGPLHGWGVTRRELAVPGHLAHSLHAATGRPVAVDFVGDERMNAASSVPWLGRSAALGHDVVVIALGMNDALRLTAVARWREDVEGLLARVLEDVSEGSPVLLVGLPHVRRYLLADSWLGTIAARRAGRLSAVLEELASTRDGVRYLPAPVERFERERPLGSSAMYLAWAQELTGPVADALDAVRASRAAAPGPDPSWDWAGAPGVIADAESGALADRLGAVLETIRESSGAAIAAVDLLDGDRARFVASTAGAPLAIPRALAYCDAVVRADAALVVLDAKKDARFRDNPFLDVVGLSFYAGVLLHALDGRAVATLCLLDGPPRSSFDAAELERLARVAERELRAVESRSAVQSDPAAAEQIDAPR